MNTISNRKKELSNIYMSLKKIENDDEKNILSACCMPRIYGHYEKFVQSAFCYLFEKLLEDGSFFYTANKKILYYIIFLRFSSYGDNHFFKNINSDVVNIKIILSEFQKRDTANNLENLFDVLEIKDETLLFKLSLLKIKCQLIRKKYRARCDIAHGHLEYEIVSFEEIEKTKELIEEIFDLFKTILDEYIENNLYKAVH